METLPWWEVTGMSADGRLFRNAAAPEPSDYEAHGDAPRTSSPPPSVTSPTWLCVRSGGSRGGCGLQARWTSWMTEHLIAESPLKQPPHFYYPKVSLHHERESLINWFLDAQQVLWCFWGNKDGSYCSVHEWCNWHPLIARPDGRTASQGQSVLPGQEDNVPVCESIYTNKLGRLKKVSGCVMADVTRYQEAKTKADFSRTHWTLTVQPTHNSFPYLTKACISTTVTSVQCGDGPV